MCCWNNECIRSDSIHSLSHCVLAKHYKSGDIEPIQYLKDKLTVEEYKGFLKGNMIKYISRATMKGSEKEDYIKALWFAEQLVEAEL